MLKDRTFDAPVIHVVSESPRLEMLQARLRQIGLRPVPVRGQYLPPDSAPALIDSLTRQLDLKGHENRLIVTIGKSSQPPAGSDIHLTDIAQLSTLPARLSIRQRETQRRRELELRQRTAQKFGAPTQAEAVQGRARLLWLGQDAPFLNAIKASLRDHGINLVAAISRLTAEDYLASGQFNTLVLCPADPDDEAARLLARVKTLPQINPPRIVLLLRPELSQALPSDVMSGADEIIDLSEETEQIAARLKAASQIGSRPLSPPALHSDIQDSATGLASRAYLEAHLEAQMEQADRLALPLSLIAIEIPDGTNTKHLASTIKTLLRDTDLAARLDARHICISLSETPYRGAVILAQRIEEALKTQIEWRAIERRRFHTLKTLLGGLTARSAIARRKRA